MMGLALLIFLISSPMCAFALGLPFSSKVWPHLHFTVASLRATGLQTSNTNVLRCSRHGGGALGARMNLFDRLARLVKVRFRENYTYCDIILCHLPLAISFFIHLLSEFICCKCSHMQMRY